MILSTVFPLTQPHKYGTRYVGMLPYFLVNVCMNTKQTKTDAKIDVLGTKVDVLTTDVSRLSGNVDKITKDVDRVTKNVDKLSKDVGQLTETVDKLSVNVDKLTNDVDKLTENVQDILVAVNHLSTHMDSEFVNVRGEIREVKDDLSTTKNEVIGEIDRFVVLHQTLDVELVSLRSRQDRQDHFLQKVAKKLDLEYERN